MDTPASSTQHDQLERSAYQLWIERGSPVGSPEVDWFRAEAQMRERSGTPAEDPDNPFLTVAKAMGAAIGSMASFVESLSALTRESDHKS